MAGGRGCGLTGGLLRASDWPQSDTGTGCSTGCIFRLISYYVLCQDKTKSWVQKLFYFCHLLYKKKSIDGYGNAINARHCMSKSVAKGGRDEFPRHIVHCPFWKDAQSMVHLPPPPIAFPCPQLHLHLRRTPLEGLRVGRRNTNLKRHESSCGQSPLWFHSHCLIKSRKDFRSQWRGETASFFRHGWFRVQIG